MTMSQRFQFSLRVLLVLMGSVVAGATTQQIASSLYWSDGKRITSLSLQGNVLFALLGATAGFVLTLAVLYSKPPKWVRVSRLGPPFVVACALIVSCFAGAFALFAWFTACDVMPRSFYQFVIQ
jgi:hypothetical protein